ncbi:MAG TPA: PH domain-containing protein [Segetibacter sp.]|jgi:hypothetical protein
MRFKASLDGLAKGITIGTSIVFVLVIIGQIFRLHSDVHFTVIITSVIILAVYLGSYLFRPIDYEVTNDSLIIRRTIKSVIIKRKEISSVQPIAKDQMKWTIRTFGVGGLFGYYGQFVNSKLGNMTWYATRRDNTVLITTILDKKIIVTPDEPEAFIKYLTT